MVIHNAVALPGDFQGVAKKELTVISRKNTYGISQLALNVTDPPPKRRPTVIRFELANFYPNRSKTEVTRIEIRLQKFIIPLHSIE